VRGPIQRLLAIWAALWTLAAGAPPASIPSGERAHAHVVALAALGPRVAGTETDRRATEYVAQSLRSFGYAVTTVPFRFPFFQTRRVRLQVLSPKSIELNPRAMIYSASTAGPITAPLVAAGKGLERDFVGVEVFGKVALVERGEIPFAEKARNASEAGATALIVYNHEPGSVVGTLGSPSRIPVVSISREEGLVLRQMLRTGPVTVTLDVQTVNEERTAHNVVGAAGQGKRKLVVGAHLDSVEGSPGANDNASGVAVVLEVARVLRAEGTPVGLEFVAFGAEELGLYGSQAYVRSERIRGTVGMVNLDMVGVGERFLVGNTGQDDRLVEITLEAARRIGVRLERFRLGSSDHVPFERAGRPVAFLHRPDDPNYHSPQDTPERVRSEFLEQAVRVVVAVARSPGVASLSGRERTKRPAAEEYNGRGGEAAR
jgi:aminopeptidase YwaD